MIDDVDARFAIDTTLASSVKVFGRTGRLSQSPLVGGLVLLVMVDVTCRSVSTLDE